MGNEELLDSLIARVQTLINFGPGGGGGGSVVSDPTTEGLFVVTGSLLTSDPTHEGLFQIG